MAKKKEKKVEYEVPEAAIEEMLHAMIGVYRKNETLTGSQMTIILGETSIQILRIIAKVKGVEPHEIFKIYGEWIASYY